MSSVLLSVLFVFLAAKSATAAVPHVFSYQGRLYDNQNNLLGGSGMTFYFRFSIWDTDGGTTGNKLWPQGEPSIMAYNVEYGVFNALIGDTASGGDELDLNFNQGSYFLQIEVASNYDFLDGETLFPRQKIVASGYAINADTVNSYHASESASGTEIPVLTDGNLIFGDNHPQINATSTFGLVFQGGGQTGDVGFYNSSNKITSDGDLYLAGQIKAGGFGLPPVAIGEGALYFNTTDKNLYFWNGQSWKGLDGGSEDAYWVLASGLLHPASSTYDINIGGISNYAKFAVTGDENEVQMQIRGYAGQDKNLTEWKDFSGGLVSSIDYNGGFFTSGTLETAGTSILAKNSGAVGIGKENPEELLDVNGNAIIRGALDIFGNSLIMPQADSTSTLQINNESGAETLFSIDTENNLVKIGDSGVAGDYTTLFTLDAKNDAGDPMGLNGAMYYNAAAGKFRCYENDAWKDCNTENSGNGSVFRNFALIRTEYGIAMKKVSSQGEELPNMISRKKIDLSEANFIRSQFAHSLNNKAAIKLRVDFSTDNCATWNPLPLVPAFGGSTGANQNQTSAFYLVPAAAKTDICVRAVIIGNGSLSPQIWYADMDIK